MPTQVWLLIAAQHVRATPALLSRLQASITPSRKTKQAAAWRMRQAAVLQLAQAVGQVTGQTGVPRHSCSMTLQPLQLCRSDSDSCPAFVLSHSCIMCVVCFQVWAISRVASGCSTVNPSVECDLCHMLQNVCVARPMLCEADAIYW